MYRTSNKTGMSTDFIEPGVNFESVFIQESIMKMLEKLYSLEMVMIIVILFVALIRRFLNMLFL